MASRVRALLLIALLAFAGVASAGCLDRIKSAYDSVAGPDTPVAPADSTLPAVNEPLSPSYAKNWTLDVQEGHVRILVKADLTSTQPDSPLPVKSPGTVKVSIVDSKGAVRKSFDLGNPPTPVYTTTVELTPERDGPLPPGPWTVKAEGRGLSGNNQGAYFKLEGRATATASG